MQDGRLYNKLLSRGTVQNDWADTSRIAAIPPPSHLYPQGPNHWRVMFSCDLSHVSWSFITTCRVEQFQWEGTRTFLPAVQHMVELWGVRVFFQRVRKRGFSTHRKEINERPASVSWLSILTTELLQKGESNISCLSLYPEPTPINILTR